MDIKKKNWKNKKSLKTRFLYYILLILIFSGCIKENEIKWMETVKKGDYCFSNNNIDMALKYWIDSLEFKKDVLTYEKIVTSLIIKRDFQNAKKYANEGLTYYSECGNLLFNLGLIEFYLEEYENSLKTLDKLIMRNKYYPDVHYLRGLIYEKKGEIEKARKEFIEEININPGSKKAWQKIKEMKK